MMEAWAELAKTLGVPGFLCFVLIIIWKQHGERQDKRADRMTDILQEQTQILRAIREAQILEHHGTGRLKTLRGLQGVKGGGMGGPGKTAAQHSEPLADGGKEPSSPESL